MGIFKALSAKIHPSNISMRNLSNSPSHLLSIQLATRHTSVGCFLSFCVQWRRLIAYVVLESYILAACFTGRSYAW